MRNPEISRRTFLRVVFGVIGTVGLGMGGHAFYRNQTVEKTVSEQYPRPTETELSRAREYNMNPSLKNDLKRGDDAVQIFKREADYQDAKAEEYREITDEYTASVIAFGITTVYVAKELADVVKQT